MLFPFFSSFIFTLFSLFFFFFFNDTATTEIYTLSLHDALPICRPCCQFTRIHSRIRFGITNRQQFACVRLVLLVTGAKFPERAEKHNPFLRVGRSCRCQLEGKIKPLTISPAATMQNALRERARRVEDSQRGRRDGTLPYRVDTAPI